MNYLYDYALISGGLLGPDGFSFAQSVYQLLNFLKDGSEAAEEIFSSFELIAFSVKLWEKDPSTSPFPNVSLMLLWCDFFDETSGERMDILTQTLGSADAVAELAVGRIRSTSDILKSPDSEYGSLIVQLKVLNKIFPLSTHPIRTALLRNAVIPLLCSIAVDVLSSKMGREDQRSRCYLIASSSLTSVYRVFTAYSVVCCAGGAERGSQHTCNSQPARTIFCMRQLVTQRDV